MYSDVPNRLRARLRLLTKMLDLLLSTELESSDQAHGSREAAMKVSSNQTIELDTSARNSTSNDRAVSQYICWCATLSIYHIMCSCSESCPASVVQDVRGYFATVADRVQGGQDTKNFCARPRPPQISSFSSMERHAYTDLEPGTW
jgi:hypothetical protein